MNDLIQSMWLKGHLLHVNGIIFGDGKVVLMERFSAYQDNKRVHYAVSALADTSLESLLHYHPDMWVAITGLNSWDWPQKGLHLMCGEGAMGNEGFVAAIQTVNNALQWAAFFTFSNPFAAIRADPQSESIIAISTYDQEWVFPLLNPELAHIRAVKEVR